MTNALGEAALVAYRASGRLIAPFAGLVLDWRTRRGKEDPARRGERFGIASHPRPDGPVVWVHAASVGETMSVLPVIEWMTRSGLSVVFTSGTVTSATLAAGRLPPGSLHQVVPLDLPPFIDRFLDHWRPVAALFVESEVWPATVVELEQRDIPQVLLNARLSERSLRRWLKVGHLGRALFQRFSLVLAQSQEDAARFRRLGVGHVDVTGNIKYDCQPLGADAGHLARLREIIGGRPVLLAASTHPGEETVIAEAIQLMAARVPDLLAIIVPRHPQRSAEIAASLGSQGMAVAIRSQGEDPDRQTRIYLADTLGELGLFYRLASVAFIGGSLVPLGGHNPIEAAQLQTAVLHGPHVQNARDIFAVLDDGGGAAIVTDARALAHMATRLLIEPATAMAMAKSAADIVLSGRGALERTRRALSEGVIAGFLPSPASARPGP